MKADLEAAHWRPVGAVRFAPAVSSSKLGNERIVAAPNPTRQKAAREGLARLFVHPATVFVIHYACESFEEANGYASPRITAIALRNLGNGATTSFSIHAEVELARRRHGDVATLDDMERAMLGRFYDFVSRNPYATFLHWNMRDEKFGFAAIAHRSALVGVEPVAVHDSQRFDLSRCFVEMFGSGYVERPYIETLARNNGLSMSSFLSGLDEAQTFTQGQYYKVLQSVLCKVSIIADCAQLACDRTLVTDAGWWTMNGGQLREAYEMFWRNPIRSLASLIVGAGGAAFVLVMRILG